MAEAEENVQELTADKPSNAKLVSLVVGAAVLVAGLTVAGTYFMFKATGAFDRAAAPGAVKVEQPKGRPAVYHSLEPPFVVNINDKGRMRYLQVEMQAMTRDPKIVEAVKQHTPLIRNALVLLLSNQTVDQLNTPDGKEQLREQALAQVQAVLQEEIGEAGVEAIYITSMVIQ